MSMIKDSFGNMGRDFNKDGILSPGEIDIKAKPLGYAASKLSAADAKVRELTGKDDWSKTGTLENVLSSINNGRVADITYTGKIKPQVGDHIILNRDNKHTSVKGIVEESALSDYFFSDTNVGVIQGTLRYKVFQFLELLLLLGYSK